MGPEASPEEIAMHSNDRTFFAPLWRRILLVAIVAAWFAYEALVVGEQMWIVIVGGLLAYAVWTYLLRWDAAGKSGDAA